MIKKLRITIDSKVYDVEVETLEDRTPSPENVAPSEKPKITQTQAARVPPPPPKPKPATPTGAGVICAPLAGIVVGVTKNIGDKVEVNDTVLLLEAMKMQTAIKASVGGTLKEIFVEVGNAVPEGTALLRIE